ncbi:sulfatase [bacterium]|nr:sulfatase [Rhodopirellula sp.]MDA7915108.1 sulfatase [bacterium]MDB4475113.1 sulfatase [bacterium]MDB4540368.1 sulfatase [bacterium]MDB4561525.1 sulfatase [bacterium]
MRKRPLMTARLGKSVSHWCASFLLLFTFFATLPTSDAEQPNVILIICDDLNDYVEGFGGHPQAQTPNMKRLASSGVSFTQAHCNIPICGPSRASMFTGIYPHHSGCFGFNKWDGYEVLKNSRTLMDHLRAHGYQTLGTGKLMHHMVRQEWESYGNMADYGPFAFDGSEKVAHPDVPVPYREIGAVDGSFGPLISLQGRRSTAGKPLSWQTGSWSKQRTLKVASQQERDATADELNGQWAVDQINARAGKPARQPFFMGVGFIRPHTPLIVPKRFFDRFPLDTIELPKIRKGDVEDTFSQSIRGIPDGADGPRSEDMGTRLYNTLVESYSTEDEALRHFIQAYLASVASVDEQVGKILEAVDQSNLKENTIIILTSDHGWGMGEKNYLYKNSLWQESTRVPLIIRAPGVARSGAQSNQAVSLIDIYPTLLDLCGLPTETQKNNKGRELDGHSLKPLLVDPSTDRWKGPRSALTALYKWRTKYDPSQESYSLRSNEHRYIRYENGKEEFYDTRADPHEWTNLANDPRYSAELKVYREDLRLRIPIAGAGIPVQPVFKPKQTASEKPIRKSAQGKLTNGDAEKWKTQYFATHPKADADQNGKLSWAEYKAYRAKYDPPRKRN